MLASLIAALWFMLVSAVTVVPLDDDAALDARGIYVNEHRQVYFLRDDGAETITIGDGDEAREVRVSAFNAGLGCHEDGEIVYYQRTPALFEADEARYYPDKPLADRVRDARAAFEATEGHELLHGGHCALTGSLAVAPSRDYARALYAAIGLDPDDWQPRPATYREAYDILVGINPGAWGVVPYCWSNEGEWFACLGTELALAADRAREAAQATRAALEARRNAPSAVSSTTTGYWGGR